MPSLVFLTKVQNTKPFSIFPPHYQTCCTGYKCIFHESSYIIHWKLKVETPNISSLRKKFHLLPNTTFVNGILL